MNLAIEHNEVEDDKVDFLACGCVFDGEAWSRCEDHTEVIEIELSL